MSSSLSLHILCHARQPATRSHPVSPKGPSLPQTPPLLMLSLPLTNPFPIPLILELLLILEDIITLISRLELVLLGDIAQVG